MWNVEGGWGMGFLIHPWIRLHFVFLSSSICRLVGRLDGWMVLVKEVYVWVT